MTSRCVIALLVLLLANVPARAGDADAEAIERGRKALLERGYYPAAVSLRGYRDLWRQWGNTQAPEKYLEAVGERYGLHPAPYANDGYPMGLRQATGLLGLKGLTLDCMLCHGGSILGQGHVGLGNASLDLQLLLDELAASSGLPVKTPFPVCSVRGTIETSAMLALLTGFRDHDLSPRLTWTDRAKVPPLCEDVPAWWHLKKKKTMYFTGSINTRAVRSLMAFMVGPMNSSQAIMREEPTFRDIRSYLLTLQPPPYPYPVKQAQARQGQRLFERHCTHCHGTYGPNGTYPNRIVPLQVIGTDPSFHRAADDESLAHFNRSWFGQEKGPWGEKPVASRTAGYQAPPLDGIWATAPYFHNGSVPTVYHVLNSRARPRIFTRSYRTDAEAYDPDRLGWRFRELDSAPDPKQSALERRKVYDTTQPGRGNMGHTFGDQLTEEERLAIIEYLKTI